MSNAVANPETVVLAKEIRVLKRAVFDSNVLCGSGSTLPVGATITKAGPAVSMLYEGMYHGAIPITARDDEKGKHTFVLVTELFVVKQPQPVGPAKNGSAKKKQG